MKNRTHTVHFSPYRDTIRVYVDHTHVDTLTTHRRVWKSGILPEAYYDLPDMIIYYKVEARKALKFTHMGADTTALNMLQDGDDYVTTPGNAHAVSVFDALIGWIWWDYNLNAYVSDMVDETYDSISAIRQAITDSKPVTVDTTHADTFTFGGSKRA